MTGCRLVDMPSGDSSRHPASTCSCYGPLCEESLLGGATAVLGARFSHPREAEGLMVVLPFCS